MEFKKGSLVALEFKKDFIVALVLSILFTIGFFYLAITLPLLLHDLLLPIIPDPWVSGSNSVYDSIVADLIPLGSLIFLLSIILVILGVVIKRFKLSFLGSLTLYLPIFANFCFTMYTFAGIGIIRLLWYPIQQISPGLLGIGDVILPLSYLVEKVFYLLHSITPPPLYVIYSIIQPLCMFIFGLLIVSIFPIGTGIFFFSIVTWFYGKFSEKELLDFWIYKYSRHPQYLGLLVCTYGLTISLNTGFVGLGSITSIEAPTLFWLIAALFIIAAAIQEENKLSLTLGENYTTWRQSTPFLLPLPSRITDTIQWLVKRLIKKDWPSDTKELLFILSVFGILLILSSVLFWFVVINIVSEIVYLITGLIDWY